MSWFIINYDPYITGSSRYVNVLPKLVGFCWRRKGTNFTQDPGITGYYNPLYKVLFFIAQG